MKNIKLSVLTLSFVTISASAFDTVGLGDKAVSFITKGTSAIHDGALKSFEAVQDFTSTTIQLAKNNPCKAALITTAAVAAIATVIAKRKAIFSGIKTVCTVAYNNPIRTALLLATGAATVWAWQAGKFETAANTVTALFTKAPVVNTLV